MDFLKSAVASAISKDPPFPYKFGDQVAVEQSIWTLHNGTKRVCVLWNHHEDLTDDLSPNQRKTAQSAASSPLMSLRIEHAFP